MTDKFSYDIIGLVALIDCVKLAADRYLHNEQQIANNTTLNAEYSSKTVTNDINLPLGPQPSEQHTPTFVRYDPLTATTYFNNSRTVGGIIPTDLRGPRIAIESDVHLAVFPSVASCLVDLQFIPNDVYNGLEAIAENIDAWRVNLVTRIKHCASTINDLQSSRNSAVYTSDLNAWSVSNILARLDHFAERLNQQDQCISNNCDDIRSLRSSIDQFSTVSETQFLSLKDQLQVLSESSNLKRLPSPPLSSVKVVDAEQTIVIEGLRGKMKGLEQTIVTECNAVKGLRDMVVGHSEKVDSSLGTALTSHSNTRGPVSGERLNIFWELDVVCKGIEGSEKLILQLISTKIPSDYVDIALIRKCNTIDLPALQSALKTCEKLLLKYL